MLNLRKENSTYHLSMLACTLGTAGVWRTRAIMEAGGWEDRTTAEDMDLAVRASLLGWGFVYVGDIKVKCLVGRLMNWAICSVLRAILWLLGKK